MTAGHALASAHSRVGVGGRAHGRFVLLLGLGTLAVLVGVVVGVAVGTVGIAPVDTLAVVLSHLGLQVGTVPSEATDAIVWDIRIPRVLTALAVGAALAVAGVTFQGLLRNPLADPYVLGTASGAALGAAIAVLLPVRTLVLGFGLVHALAFAGALVAVWAVYRLSRIAGMAPMTGLLLTGYAVGSLLAAGLTMAMYLSGAQLRQIFSFLLGGFDGASWARLAGALPLIASGASLILLRARSLNGLLLGEEAAAHLGVDVRRERASCSVSRRS